MPYVRLKWSDDVAVGRLRHSSDLYIGKQLMPSIHQGNSDSYRLMALPGRC